MSGTELILDMDKKLVVSARRLSYSIPEAARLIGVGPTLLKELIEEGQGPPTFRLHTRVLISGKDLVEWLLEQAEQNRQQRPKAATVDVPHAVSH